MGYRRRAVGVQQERAGLDRCPGWAPSGARLIVEVEVARRLLLEPQAVVLGRLLEEVGRLLEHVLLLARARRLRLQRLLGGDLVAVLVEPRILFLARGDRRGRLLLDRELVGRRRRWILQRRLGLRFGIQRAAGRELVALPRAERF